MLNPIIEIQSQSEVYWEGERIELNDLAIVLQAHKEKIPQENQGTIDVLILVDKTISMDVIQNVESEFAKAKNYKINIRVKE